MIDKKEFSKITYLVISALEGGYYHPDMLTDGRIKDTRYNSSGETMFGIDRKNGGAINTSTDGKKFWAVIDNAGARSKWKYNYMGGDLAPQLKELAAAMMYPVYNTLASAYLSTKAKPIVEKDSRLLFHFIYAAWNGAGWFKKFASDINKAVESGITNPDTLAQVAINSRTKEGLTAGSKPNSLIAQTGAKIANIFETLPVNNDVNNNTNFASLGGGLMPIIAILILLSILFKR